MRMGGVDVQTHIFLTLELVGGEWSASSPGRFTPGERTPGTHWIGGWVDLRAGLGDVVKRKFLTLPGSNTNSYVVQLLASPYTHYAIPALQFVSN
jgi:hypothetical protein